MKEKKTITGTDVAIICFMIGVIASIILIVRNFIDRESMTVGIILLCVCAINLLVNVKNKKNAQ